MAKSSDALDELDEEQRAAVTAPAGPVCILAGAGTGKTRAITRRIAHRVHTGEVRAQHVLAVTFTARAAAEMRARLTALGAAGVQARTFHAAALRQLRYFAPRLFAGRDLPELIDRKGRLVGQAATRAGITTDQTGARDLAAEIEWAKACLVEPSEYEVAAAKARREPPFAPATVAKVFDGYERLKRAAGVIDFEDLLRAAAWGIEEHSDVAEQVRAQYRHFVVDEYQDVNPVQQRLLDAWLGGRDDITVVGDASQTIYSFTGASSDHLVSFPRRYRGATVVRLVRDYRSTPQVVGLANAVISQARGELARLRLELHGQRPSGPEPELRSFPDEPAEATSVARKCAELIAAGTPAREIAVLFRINAQSEVYEAALAEAGVPYVVHGAERFFERAEIRQALVALRAATRTVEAGTPLHDAVVGALDAIGWRPNRAPAGGASRERWEALAALAALCDEFAQERQDLPEGAPLLEAFNAELARRAAAQHAPAVDGVTLSSLHSAKGLEWDAVFLVGLAEGTLPIRHARTADALEEERRLAYVGITRARHWLWLSYAVAQIPGGRQRRACRFVPALDPDRPAPAARTPGRTRKEADGTRRRILVSCRICGTALISGADRKLGRCSACPSDLDEELLSRLQEWRVRVAARQKVPPYVVFTDVTLAALAERRPARSEELVAISGIGPRKLGMYGTDVLRLIDGTPVDDVEEALPEGLEK
ncbi:DNA helicase [Virgisporangium aliadipatigenens]|uniref:DNA 3'-5' helicase n=1 Tax=Virgisporangium aliadipatigenens TaxID=741659 RepID=A0A8J4DVH4_9ACTN|nr:DNA helicase [Virgisporangium aliadipatigenens]